MKNSGQNMSQQQKNHILSNQNQHVKNKQSVGQMESKQTKNEHHVLQVGTVQVGHKKSNSIQNQRMMQLLMNKQTEV